MDTGAHLSLSVFSTRGLLRFTRKRFTDENWDVLDIVRELVEEKDATAAQVSLAWLLHKDIVDAPIVGARTLNHLEDNVAALDIELMAEEIDRLEAPITPVWNRDIGDV